MEKAHVVLDRLTLECRLGMSDGVGSCKPAPLSGP